MGDRLSCPHCGGLHTSMARYCPEVGQRLPPGPACSNCGESLLLGWDFCPRCSQAIRAATPVMREPEPPPETIPSPRPRASWGRRGLVLAVPVALVLIGYLGVEAWNLYAASAVGGKGGRAAPAAPASPTAVPVGAATTDPSFTPAQTAMASRTSTPSRTPTLTPTPTPSITPSPTLTPLPPGHAFVPDVSGLTWEEASRRLSAAGFSGHYWVPVADMSKPENLVYKQEPEAGRLERVNTTRVKLYIAIHATSTPRATPTPTEYCQRSGSSWVCASASSYVLSSGSCTNLTWNSGGLVSIYLDGRPTVGIRTERVCLRSSWTYTLAGYLRSGGTLTVRIPITVR